MVKHKSRLEREKEVAEQQRKAEEAAQAQRAKRKVVHTPGAWAKQVWHPELSYVTAVDCFVWANRCMASPDLYSFGAHLTRHLNLERHCRSSKA